MGGLASGLDTTTIIAQLMSVERQPRARIELDQVAAQARKDALADIQAKLKTLKTASADLKSTLTWGKAQQVTSSEPNRISAKVTGEVDPRTFDITVQRLAVTSERRFDFAAGGASVDITPTSTGVTTSIDLSTATNVDEAAAIINGAGVDVTAKNVNGQLQLLSKTNGAAGGFTATGTGLTEKSSKTGVDAAFAVDGVAKTATTNVITDAIPGIELELKGLTPTDPVAISATPNGIDKDKVKAEVKQFVEAYNSALDAMRAKTSEQRVRNPTNNIDARKGVLYADGGLRQVISSMRNATMNDVTGTGNALTLDNLAEFGISTGKGSGGTSTAESLAGKLVIDDAKLTKALEDDPASVERLFTGDNGFATRMESILNPLLETDGTFEGRLDASDAELKSLKTSLETMDQRLTRKEEQYRKQFTALEVAMSRAQAQQSSMASALAGLPNFNA
jgi:flagellar hook-associated protein 2